MTCGPHWNGSSLLLTGQECERVASLQQLSLCVKESCLVQGEARCGGVGFLEVEVWDGGGYTAEFIDTYHPSFFSVPNGSSTRQNIKLKQYYS